MRTSFWVAAPAAVVALSVWSSACSNSTPAPTGGGGGDVTSSTSKPMVCSPGQQISCEGDDNTVMIETCAADGSGFSDCPCPPSAVSATSTVVRPATATTRHRRERRHRGHRRAAAAVGGGGGAGGPGAARRGPAARAGAAAQAAAAAPGGGEARRERRRRWSRRTPDTAGAAASAAPEAPMEEPRTARSRLPPCRWCASEGERRSTWRSVHRRRDATGACVVTPAPARHCRRC